jgi:chromosome segregation ATPase
MPRNKKGPPKSPTFFTSAPQKVDLPPFPPKETPTETTENNPLDQVKDLIAEDFPQFEGGTQKIAPFSSQMVDQLNEQVHQLEAENEILKQQNQDTTDHLTQTLQQKDEELSQIKEFFSQQNGEMAQYQESLQKVMDEMHEKDNQIEELNQKNQEIQTNLDFVSNQLTEFQEKIKEKEVIIQQISQENSQLDDNIEQFMNERTQLEENVTQLEKQMAEATAKSSSESEDRFLQLTEENEQLADALKESDRKYQILFEEHSKIVKAHLKDEYQTSPVDKSENDDPSNEDAIDN